MTIAQLLKDQDGLIHREQAVAAGLSTSAVDRRLAAGTWLVVNPRVYRAADRPLLPRARLRAAAMWAGPGATLIGSSALAWWRVVDEYPAVAVLAVDTGHTAPRGIRLVRRPVPESSRALVDGLRVLHRAPALLEAAVEKGQVDGARLVDRVLQGGHADVDGLEAALTAFGQRHGVVRARALVDLARQGARSEAERRLLRGLRRRGCTGFVPNLEVDLPGWGRVVLDVAFPERRVVVEVDGWAFHRDVDRFRHDARRQNALVLAGWRVVRVTWYDLVEDLDGTLALITGALALSA